MRMIIQELIDEEILLLINHHENRIKYLNDILKTRRTEIHFNKTNMNFGQAIEALKSGQVVARQGWNGKGMYLTLNRGSIAADTMTDGVTIDGVAFNLFDQGDQGTVTRLPNINMRTATGSIVTGWLASQTDMLAEDWCLLPATA
jgi:hypothetical protein